jgi:hypothetical protein
MFWEEILMSRYLALGFLSAVSFGGLLQPARADLSSTLSFSNVDWQDGGVMPGSFSYTYNGSNQLIAITAANINITNGSKISGFHFYYNIPGQTTNTLVGWDYNNAPQLRYEPTFEDSATRKFNLYLDFSGIAGSAVIIADNLGGNYSSWADYNKSTTLTRLASTGTSSGTTPIVPAAASNASPNPVNLGVARVGGSVSQNLSITNTATPSANTERLDGSISSNSIGIIAGGSFSLLSAQSTSTALHVGLDTSTSGVKSGTATISLASDGQGTTGAGTTALSSQTVSVSGKVYQPAAAQVPASLSFGTVHVGDVAQRALTVMNTAGGALNDSLVVGVAGATGPFSGSGSSTIAAGQSGSGTVFSLNTATAGSFTGTGTLNLTSRDADLADLSLGTAGVALSGLVDNYAVASFGSPAGAATFSGSGTNYSLDFGQVLAGRSATSNLSLFNGASGLADLLAGSFFETGSGFSLSGFDAFSGLSAGQARALTVSFSPMAPGSFSEVIDLKPRGSNASGYDAALPDVYMTITGIAVPEPTSTGMFGIALIGLAGLRRRAAASGKRA